MTAAELRAGIDRLAAEEARTTSRAHRNDLRAAWARRQRLELERQLDQTDNPPAGGPSLFDFHSPEQIARRNDNARRADQAALTAGYLLGGSNPEEPTR